MSYLIGYEAQAVPDNMVAKRIESASYAMGRHLELNAISELEENGTTESSTTPLTNENAYTSIKDSVIKIKKLGIDINKCYIYISADTESLLLEDTKFANSSDTVGAELLRNGVIGKIAGVGDKASYNMSANVEYMVVATEWAQSIDEFKVEPKIVTLEGNGTHVGASALIGRFIYEDKLTNALACRVKTISVSV